MVPELLVAVLTVYLTLSLMYGRKVIFWFLSVYPRGLHEYVWFFAWRASVYFGCGVYAACLKQILVGSY